MSISLLGKPLATLLLAVSCQVAALSAAAAPITLFDTSAVVLGIAEDAGSVDAFLVESPPDLLPISGEALSDQAVAFASAGADSLLVNAEVIGEAVAGATAVVDALFARPAGSAREFVLAIDVDYGSFGLQGFAVDAMTELLFAVLADGVEVLSSALTFTGDAETVALRERFTLPADTTGAVTFILSSELLGVDPAAGGGVFAVADFAVATVDEPFTVTTLILGLTLTGLLRVSRRRLPTVAS